MQNDKTTVEFKVLRGLIDSGQLADAASELGYIQSGGERETLIAYLLDACCERGEHTLAKKVFQTFETHRLSQELLRRVHALAETHDVDDDFQSSLPTVVGFLPIPI